VHPFAPHTIAELPLALDDQHAGAALGHGPAERRPAETTAYDKDVVQNRLR
jgi:hypothetical protein